jgi:hypothetical protein
MSISEIIRLVLSVAIVFFSILSTYYGIRYLFLPDSKKDKDYWYSCMITGVSIAWTVLFSYMSIFIISGFRAEILDEFAIMFVRPILLITISLMAVYQRIKYLDGKINMEIKKEHRLNKEGET